MEISHEPEEIEEQKVIDTVNHQQNKVSQNSMLKIRNTDKFQFYFRNREKSLSIYSHRSSGR